MPELSPEADHRLKDHSLCILATGRKDGSPQQSYIGYQFDGSQFLLGGGAYALLYQVMLNNPLDEFGFGVVNFAPYQEIPQFNIPDLGFTGGYELFSLTLLNFYGMTHYYVDSFIWKVRDKKVQRRL